MPKFLPKFVFILLSVVIVGELIWGVWYISQPIPKVSQEQGMKNTFASQSFPASIILVSPQEKVSAGENLIVDVIVSTASNPTYGTDLQIKYDPKFLTLEGKATDFTSGDQYAEYLNISVDNQKGEASVSGISNPPENDGKNGSFGSLKFKVKQAGTTAVSVVFKKGSTSDSNVIATDTSQDILGQVTNLEVEIN